MADEKKASTAVKKGVGRRDTDPANKTAAQTENGSVEDKLRGAIELIGRVSTEANERKSEQEKNAKRYEEEAKLRIQENKLRRANDERQARLVAEQRLEALTYAENYRKKMVRDQLKSASAKKALADQKKAEEEARVREERAKELAEMIEREKKEAMERTARANALLEKIASAAENGEAIPMPEVAPKEEAPVAEETASAQTEEVAAEETVATQAEEITAPVAEEDAAADTEPVAENTADTDAEDTASEEEEVASSEEAKSEEAQPVSDDDSFVISIGEPCESESESDDGKIVIDTDGDVGEGRVLRFDENGECADEIPAENTDVRPEGDTNTSAYAQYYGQMIAAQQYAWYMENMRRQDMARRAAMQERAEASELRMKEAEERRIAEFEERMDRIDGIMKKYETSRINALLDLVNAVTQPKADAVSTGKSPSESDNGISEETDNDIDGEAQQPKTILHTLTVTPDEPLKTTVELLDGEGRVISGDTEDTEEPVETEENGTEVADVAEAQAPRTVTVHKLITAPGSAPRVIRESEEAEYKDENVIEEELSSEELADGESASAIVETDRSGVRDTGFERAIEYMDREMLPSYLAKNDRASKKLASKVKRTEKKQIKTTDKGVSAGMLVDCINAQKRIIDIECDSLNNCCYVESKRGIRRYEKRVDMAVVDYNRLADDYENLCGGSVKRASLTTSDKIISGEMPEELPLLNYHTEDVAILSESVPEPVSPFNRANAASSFDKRSARALIDSNEKEIKNVKRNIEKLNAKKKKLEGADRTECIVNVICAQRVVVDLYCGSLTAACSLRKSKLVRKYSQLLTSEIASYNAYAEEYEYFTSDTITRADVDIPHRIVSGESYTPIPVITYTREDVGVVSEKERAARRMSSVMDKRLLERYLAASREEEKKYRRKFRRLEKQRARATTDEAKAECIVASLTAKKQIIDLLCRNLENAVAVTKKSRYTKRLKKALNGDIYDYNKIVGEYEELFNDTLTRADESIAENIISGAPYTVLPALNYVKDEPTVDSDSLSAKRAAAVTDVIDRKNFTGYAVSVEKRAGKLNKEYKRTHKKLDKAKSREDKVEYIVKCLSTRRLMIELYCEALDTACGIRFGRYIKRYRKKLTKNAIEYNKLVDLYEDTYNDILTRASETLSDDIVAGRDYETPPVLTYQRTDIRETKSSKRENRSMRIAGAMERRRLPKYFLTNDKKIKQLEKKLADAKRAYGKAITDEDRAECTVKRLTYIKGIIDINCDSLEVACHYKVKKYIKRFKNAITASVYSYNETVEEYESVFNDTLTRASASIADDIIAGKEYTAVPELTYNRVVPEESARAFAIVTADVNRRRIPKLLRDNDKEVKRLSYQLKKLDKKKRRLKKKRDKAQSTVNALTVQKQIVEIQCDSLSGSCHAKKRKFIRKYKKALAVAVAGYNRYVDEYAAITGETLTKAPETLPTDITLGRRYMPLPTLTFNSSVFDAEEAIERQAARKELRRPQMSISQDVVAQGKLERQIKSQADKDLATITKYATHEIGILERERDVKRVNFGPETGKSRRSGRDIAKKIKKIKKWHKIALAHEIDDNKRYYEIISADPSTVKVKRRRADRDVLASLRARLVVLLNERDEINGKLISIYTGEDVDPSGMPVGNRYRELQNKAANKSYKKQKSLAKAVKGLHVTVDEKERIYELMNKKTQLEANLELYVYKLKKEKCDRATKRRLIRDIKNTKREIKRTTSDIKYLLKRAKARDARTRGGGAWMMVWGVILLLFIAAVVCVFYFFGDQIRPIIDSFLGGGAA